jgi:phytoene dehydrogenase-like protein
MLDALVIGSGPNGLSAAVHLARAGAKVLVVEASATVGGACQSRELTEPGFVHDVGAGFFPFARISPAFAPLKLEEVGLRLAHTPIDSAHPALDGSTASLSRLPAELRAGLGLDGDKMVALARWFDGQKEPLLDALLGPFPPLTKALGLSVDTLLTLATVALSSGRRFAETTFATEAARRVVPALALHTDVGPDDPLGAIVGFFLAMMACTEGFPVLLGGSSALPKALLARLFEHDGEIRTKTRVEAIVVRNGRAVAARTTMGEEIEARVIVADVGAPALYLKLLPREVVSPWIVKRMNHFPYGFGTFKADFALDGQVPFLSADARRAGVVHAAESLDDLSRFTERVRAGVIPEQPYLVIGQHSLADPSRAPRGKHTLYVYSRVPARVPGGWDTQREAFGDRIEARLEGLAPGFRKLVRARALFAPNDLEAMNENLVDGDLGGGSAAITNQLFLRPIFPYFRGATPVQGLFLGSAYAHPGAGVHGAAGWNAAQAALRALGTKTT